MSEPKVGGKPLLRLLALGGPELTDVLLSKAEGGGKLERGLRERVVQQYAGRFQVEVGSEPGTALRSLAEWVPSSGVELDVVLVSTQVDVVTPGRLDREQLREDACQAVKALKESGAHILFLNTSTVDPADRVTNYHGFSDDTPALRAHKIALELVDRSHEQGVSIIDADRLLAEMGAERHVEDIGRYSADASEILCEEVIRVLADYGFFEERPLVVQAGRSGR